MTDGDAAKAGSELPAEAPSAGSGASGASGAFARHHLHGLWAAMPLPWQADGTLDGGLLRELVARYRAAGVDGAYCTGTDGEFHVLEFDEFETVVGTFAAAAERVGLPSQAGVGWVTARGILDRARAAAQHGISCVQVAPPFWVPLNEREMVGFFVDLATRLPDMALVLYNTERIGRVIGPTETTRLAAETPTLIGSKYDGYDRAQFASIVNATPMLRHFVVDVGIGPSARYPTQGMYSWMVNLNPDWTVEWWAACASGDWEEADRRTHVGLDLMRDWEAEWGGLTASPALAKICTKAGILPEMPLRIRAPYEAGTDADVARLRALIEARYPELVYQP